MAFFIKSSSKNKSGQRAEASGWVAQEGGYEVTSSSGIIKDILTQLKNNRRSLTIVQEDYQSGGAILVGVDQKRIAVDKPVDFPGDKLKAVIVFRYIGNIRHHFHSKVVSVTADTVYLQFPGRMLRLQRREYFRVDLPAGSTAQGKYEEQTCLFDARDVSAGGMLLLSRDPQGIDETGAILEDLVLNVPASAEEDRGSGDEGEAFQVGRGEVVRRTYNQESAFYYIGIRFMDSENKELMYFIRQRELEVLRKGVTK